MSGIELLAGERKKHETGRAIQGCNDYLRLGAGRSMRILWEGYTKQDNLLPPTTTFQTIKTWSANYGWVARAELFDAEIERLKNVRHEEIMLSGLALDHERVQELKSLASFLIDEIEQANEDGKRPKVWLADVKQIGSGELAERIDIERYNSAIFSDLRGVLDDLAKETGGRVTKVAPVTPDGKEEYGKDASRQRLALLDQLIATEQASNSGPDTQ